MRGETNSRAATSLLPRPSLTSFTTSSRRNRIPPSRTCAPGFRRPGGRPERRRFRHAIAATGVRYRSGGSPPPGRGHPAGRHRVGQGPHRPPPTWAVWSLAPGYVGLADAANPKWLLQWLLRRRGKLTSNGGEALAHIRPTVEAPACDVQLIFTPGDARADPRGGRFQPALSVGHSYWMPKSRGSVVIRSSDPAVPPAIRMTCSPSARLSRHSYARSSARARSSPPSRLHRPSSASFCPARARISRRASETPRKPPPIRPAASRWAVTLTARLTRSCGFAVWTTFAWPTRRRYPRSPAPTPTPRRS